MAVNGKIEIEKIVKQRLDAEGRTVKWFCGQLGWDRKKWYRFQENGLIEVHDLQRVGVILKHNFLEEFLKSVEMNHCGFDPQSHHI